MEPSKQTLTLEAGKYYKTRDGDKAFVAGFNPFCDGGISHVSGFISDEGSVTWDKNGRYFGGSEQCYKDIVAEWVEPKRIKGWLNVYPADCDGDYRGSFIYLLKARADEYATPDRIACIEVDFLEGAGLGEVA